VLTQDPDHVLCCHVPFLIFSRNQEEPFQGLSQEREWEPPFLANSHQWDVDSTC